MKKIILLLFKMSAHSGYCLLEHQILAGLNEESPFLNSIRFVEKSPFPYKPSKRISYYRSFKRLTELGLVEMTWEPVDFTESEWKQVSAKRWKQAMALQNPRTKEFKCFSLTDKGMKEAIKIRKQISEAINEFQNLL